MKTKEAFREPSSSLSIINDSTTKVYECAECNEVQEEKRHRFENPETAKYFADLYEQTQYEGRHHFDPTMAWNESEVRKAVRKTDLNAVLFAFILLFALDVDRYNLSNAVSGTFLQDLKLTTNDYNLGNTINTVFFLIAEIPSQLLSKKVGPDRWIPIQIVVWSTVATLQCLITNKTQFLITRAILGFLEGGFIPCMCLWLSYFYKGPEMSTRIGYFYLANPITSAISSLMAFGIFHLEGKTGWKSWQYIFLIEGLFTLSIGIVASFHMPPSTAQTHKRWRPSGWYTPREEKIMVNRLLRDDPYKGGMHNREGLGFKGILRGVFDWYMWPMYLCRLLIDIISHPIKTYLPILLKSMGFRTTRINLLMIPYCFGTILTMQTQTHISHKMKQIGWVLLSSPVWLLPCILAMRYWRDFLVDNWPSYALITVCLAYPPSWPLSVSWVSANANSVQTRTIALPLLNCFGQFGSIIGNQIFRMDDAPRYHRGLEDLVGICIVAIACVTVTRLFYEYMNIQRGQKWNKMSIDEQQNYIESSKVEGNRRLDARFTL